MIFRFSFRCLQMLHAMHLPCAPFVHLNLLCDGGLSYNHTFSFRWNEMKRRRKYAEKTIVWNVNSLGVARCMPSDRKRNKWLSSEILFSKAQPKCFIASCCRCWEMWISEKETNFTHEKTNKQSKYMHVFMRNVIWAIMDATKSE